MALVSRGTIKDKAKSRADMEESDFISDSEWNTIIYDSVCALVELVSRQNQDHYLEEVTLTASGLDTMDLPSDLLEVRGMDEKNGDSYQTMEPFMLAERNKYSNPLYPFMSDRKSSFRYRLQGASKVRVVPRATSTSEFRLWYTPSPTPFASDLSSIEVFNGWDEWVVLDVAIKALGKEQSDASHLLMERKIVENRIMEAAQRRQTDTGDQVIFPEDIWDV